MIINIDGTPSADPVLPALPRNRYPIALVYVNAGATRLTNDVIFDARPIFASVVRSHFDLTDTLSDNCHPVTAISGLTDLVSTLATLTNLSDGLATKADVDGTAETTFTLNKDQTGTPSTDVYLMIERGALPNVGIRWNESLGRMEYTNDGSTWNPFA